jgi:hypothetical protein
VCDPDSLLERISFRVLLIDQSDHIYRLGVAKFGEMLGDPSRYAYSQFAGQRVRSAHAVVLIADRRPTEVLRLTFSILTFDQSGYLDAKAHLRQQASLYAAAIASTGRSSVGTPLAATDHVKVVDARRLFVGRGGCWIASATLERTIREIVLGRVKCRHLQTSTRPGKKSQPGFLVPS